MRLTLILLCLALAGCSNVQTLRDAQPGSEDFNHALATEYQAYSESEYEQWRVFSAEHYAGKGLKALNGETVEPEPLDTSLSDSAQQELAAGRAMLMTLLKGKMKEKMPQKLARAQLLFDCWQHEQSRGLNQEKAPCGDEFHSTVADLASVADRMLYNHQKIYTLDFPPGSAKLGAKNHALIKQIAHGVMHKKEYAIDIEGHSSDGEAAAKLGQLRLAAVRKLFVQAGVPLSHLQGINEDESEKVYLSFEHRPEEGDKLVVTVKTHNPGKGEGK